MIGRDFREKQIRRMAGLDKYPKFEPEAEGELVIVAGRFGCSEAHLRSIVDEIMDTWTQCPKPSEFRALLDRDRKEVVNVNCSECRGSGWRIVEAGDNSGAKRCHCGSVPRPPGEGVPYSDNRTSTHAGTLTKVNGSDLPQ